MDEYPNILKTDHLEKVKTTLKKTISRLLYLIVL